MGDFYNVDVPLPGELTDPIKTLRGWQRQIQAVMKPDSAWEEVINDIMAGKPRKISRYKMAVVYEHGTPDPFNEKPPRGSLRDSLRWIWDCALYPWRIATGRLERPSKRLYVFHNLELVEPAPPIEINITFKDDLKPSLERIKWEMRKAMFWGGL